MNFSGVKILCVGDIILDRYVQGEVERVSPEAPVPVIRLGRTRTMLGGAGNVANNIAALGGTAVLLGLVGRDETAATLRAHLAGVAGIRPVLVETSHRPTVCKTRFMASRQQVVRTDDESSLATQDEETEALIAALPAALAGVQAVILSDYGKGVLAPAVIARAIALARAAPVPVFADPKSETFARYAGATCITPNVKELTAAARMPAQSDEEVAAAARRVMADAACEAILVTRSERGMMLIERNGDTHAVPTRAREVFDVSGAGDTVIATLALAHASGLALSQAMRISNAAAGVVVSKVGTATVEPAELLRELDDSPEGSHAGAPVLGSHREAAGLVARWKHQGLRVGFTNGCFDIVHAGHVSLLAAARAQCDRLVVALNTDASVRRLKGDSRPVNTLAQRCAVIAALRHVDCVVGFAEDTPRDLIALLLPDRLFKGADYRAEDVVGGDIVREAGGAVVLIDLVPGHSTSGIVARIREGV